MPEANGQYYYEFKKGSSRTQISKTFCPNIDLGVLWLKDATIVLLETIPSPPASEYWRALEGNGNYSVEDTFTPKL